MKVRNPWRENGDFDVESPIYENGHFRIFKQFDKCYLHTYKDLAFNQLMTPNIELIECHIKQEEPLTKPLVFWYRRGKKLIDTIRSIEPKQKEIKKGQLNMFD